MVIIILQSLFDDDLLTMKNKSSIKLTMIAIRNKKLSFTKGHVIDKISNAISNRFYVVNSKFFTLFIRQSVSLHIKKLFNKLKSVKVSFRSTWKDH